MRTRTFAPTASRCCRSCVKCSAASRTSRAYPVEHAVPRLADLHGLPVSLDVLLRDLLRDRLQPPALPQALRAGDVLGADVAFRAEVDLPAGLLRHGQGEPAAGKSHRAVEAFLILG